MGILEVIGLLLQIAINARVLYRDWRKARRPKGKKPKRRRRKK